MKKRTLQSMIITVVLVFILLIPICISIGADEEEKPTFEKGSKEICVPEKEMKHREGERDKKFMPERRVKPGDREPIYKDRLFKSLDLSEDQKKDLDELFKTHRESVRNTMQELREKKASKEEFGETFKKFRTDFENNLLEILTPEQYEKYKEAKEQYREQLGRMPLPKPEKVNFEDKLGLSDEQKEQYKQIKEDYSTKRKKLNEEFASKIKGILTDEQLEKYEGLKKERKSREK